LPLATSRLALALAAVGRRWRLASGGSPGCWLLLLLLLVLVLMPMPMPSHAHAERI
jgi:hypothetical protein